MSSIGSAKGRMARKIPYLTCAGLLLTAYGAPVAACVVCGSEGACYDQPITLSGNCECSITSRFGALVCVPKGVCDPNDPNTCSPTHTPGVLAADQPSPVVHPRFLDITAAKDPLLAAALSGALEEERDANGVVIRSRINVGERSGTMGVRRDHRSFKYHVDIQQYADTMFAVSVDLEEEGTGIVRRYDGALYESGLRGEFARLDDGKPVPVVVWDLRERAGNDRPGKDPQN